MECTLREHRLLIDDGADRDGSVAGSRLQHAGLAAAGAASAVGTRLHDASRSSLRGAFCGAEPPVIFFSSVTFSLSAVSAKVSCGAWKLAMLRLPLALVEPSEAARLVRFTEFCVNCRFALRMFSGCVSDGVFSDAFCIAPEPLNFMASVFLIGPVA